MRRRQCFVDVVGGVELVLPVTPATYAWENGINVELVNIDKLGDIILPGHKALDTQTIECLLPAHDYSFNEPDALTTPFVYIEQFERWAQERTPLRYIVSGTPLNAGVIIQSIKYREEDGTNDVLGTITIREYRVPQATSVLLEANAVGLSRDSSSASTSERTYVVVAGDTLMSIARRFYGDGSKYRGLAEANALPNPDLIHPGQVLTIPSVGNLPAGTAVAQSGPPALARATRATYNSSVKRWTMQLKKEEWAQ